MDERRETKDEGRRTIDEKREMRDEDTREGIVLHWQMADDCKIIEL
jgi:hypothetical protein